MTGKRPVSLELDFRSGLPIYVQIMKQIGAQILAGKLKAGDQLPTVRALADELGVNFNTVARAYSLLDKAQLISTQQGRGTYILSKRPPAMEDRLRNESLEALARHYVREALRLNFSRSQITQAMKVQLKSRKGAQNKEAG
jgi:GntR family transcriptional regulator